MRLHRMPRDIGVIAHIGIVEISDVLLVVGIEKGNIERRNGRHDSVSGLGLIDMVVPCIRPATCGVEAIEGCPE